VKWIAVVYPTSLDECRRACRSVILNTVLFFQLYLMFQRLLFAVAGVCIGSATLSAFDEHWRIPDPSPAISSEHDEVLNGVRLYYRVAGASDQTPVVFLHGGPGYNSHSFATLAGPRLENDLKMIYFDQRGSGRSERPWTQAYSIDILVQDIEALRQRLGAPRIALIGHSFGGTLALEYAARYPEHVSRIVFVDGLSDGPASIRSWRGRLGKFKPEAAKTAPVSGTNPSDSDRVCAEAKANMNFVNQTTGKDGKAFFDSMQFVDQEIRKKQDAIDEKSGLKNTGELSNALFSGGLACYRFTQHSRLTMPVLVIGGRHDGAIGMQPMRELAAKLPHATLSEYEQSAHFPYLEEPDRFAAEVIGFLAEGRSGQRDQDIRKN
jgi:proline iminopeptidase